VEDGEGIQCGHPVTVTFLQYRWENEILQDMTHCISSIVSQWKALLEGLELSVRRTMGGNWYSALDWDSAVQKVLKMGQEITTTELEHNAMDNGLTNDPVKANADLIQPAPDQTILSLGFTGVMGSKLRKMAARGEWALAPYAMVMTESHTRPHLTTHIDVGLIGVATTRKGELSWEEISVVDWTVMASVTPHRSLAGKTKAVFRSLVQAASDDAGGSASK
jgi:hypothetical protein